MQESTNKLNTQQELLYLQDMTRRTGVLYEQQVLQLELWPHTLFDLDESKQFVNIEASHIEYSWKSINEITDEHFMTRLGVLDGRVKWLLGNNWTVSTVLNGVKFTGNITKLGWWAKIRRWIKTW